MIAKSVLFRQLYLRWIYSKTICHNVDLTHLTKVGASGTYRPSYTPRISKEMHSVVIMVNIRWEMLLSAVPEDKAIVSDTTALALVWQRGAMHSLPGELDLFVYLTADGKDWRSRMTRGSLNIPEQYLEVHDTNQLCMQSKGHGKHTVFLLWQLTKQSFSSMNKNHRGAESCIDFNSKYSRPRWFHRQ